MDEETKEKKMDERIGAGVYKNQRGEVGLYFGRFPSKLATEWEVACKEEFNGVRWMKAWTDWKNVQSLSAQIQVLQMENEQLGLELQKLIAEKQSAKEEKEQPEQVLTIGMR